MSYSFFYLFVQVFTYTLMLSKPYSPLINRRVCIILKRYWPTGPAHGLSLARSLWDRVRCLAYIKPP